MGSPTTDPDRLPDNKINHERQHVVHLSCGFYMAVTEVTRRQFKEVMGFDPTIERYPPGFTWESEEVRLSLPVDHVSWYQAVEFCRKLSRREGLPFRLPTESEWEYAARAGTTTRFWFGDLKNCPEREDDNGCYCPEIGKHEHWCGSLTGSNAQPVGQKDPNPWGLYDMLGNAWEWCHDWMGYYPDGEVWDPSGPKSGVFKVVRSGGINNFTFARASGRWGVGPDHTDLFWLGFRIVLGGCPAPEYSPVPVPGFPDD